MVPIARLAGGVRQAAKKRIVRGHSIGFVFQYHHLIPAFTAHENVLMPMLAIAAGPTPRCAAAPTSS